jgi:hypothetical protein
MNHGTKKLAFALLEKSTGDIWYLPASPISCKGASYPGGVAQTNMTTYNEGYSSVNKGQLDSNNMLKTFTVWKAGSGTDFYKKYENIY